MPSVWHADSLGFRIDKKAPRIDLHRNIPVFVVDAVRGRDPPGRSRALPRNCLTRSTQLQPCFTPVLYPVFAC